MQNNELFYREEFVIDTDTKADWAVRKIKEAKEEYARIEKIANDQREEIRQRMAGIEKSTNNQINNLTALLAAYFEEVGPTKTTKTQAKRELLSGALVLKKQQPEFVRDEADMIPWAKQTAPELVRVEEKINWAEMKKQITLSGEDVLFDGEVVPGVKAYDRPDIFEVK